MFSHPWHPLFGDYTYMCDVWLTDTSRLLCVPSVYTHVQVWWWWLTSSLKKKMNLFLHASITVSICTEIQQGARVIIFQPVPLSSVPVLQMSKLWSWFVISIPSYVIMNWIRGSIWIGKAVMLWLIGIHASVTNYKMPKTYWFFKNPGQGWWPLTSSSVALIWLFVWMLLFYL